MAQLGRSLCLVMAVAVLLTSCSLPVRKDSEDQPEAQLEPITIMANLHTPSLPTDTILHALEEYTGTKLSIDWVRDEGYDERLMAKWKDGTLPKVVYLRNYASMPLLLGAFQRGEFWELGPYLKDYPYLSKLEPRTLQGTSIDGKIYTLYQERPWSRQGVIYRKDWADRLGLPAPRTIDDLYTMAKAFTNEDPDGNGLHDTVGLAERGDLIWGGFKTVSSYFGTPNNWAVKGGRVYPEFEDPAYIETMKWYKRLYDEGLINRNFAVATKLEQQEQVLTGKAGMYIGSLEEVGYFNQQKTKLGVEFELDVANRIKGPNGYGIWSIPGYSNLVVIPKSSVQSEEELKGILAFLDKLMSPESSHLLLYGMEGIHYRNGNGYAVVTNRELWEQEVRSYYSLQIGGDRTLDLLTPYYEDPVRAKALEQVRDNNKILIHDPTSYMALESETYTEKGAELYRIIKAATYKFILGSLDEDGFRRKAAEWRSKGGDTISWEFTQSFQTFPSRSSTTGAGLPGK